jgi:Rieske Fe-S protein
MFLDEDHLSLPQNEQNLFTAHEVCQLKVLWQRNNLYQKFQKENPGSALKIAGNVEDFTVNSVTADRINKYFLVRNEDGGFLALSLTCSHLGCSVLWEEGKNQFICPCHSSAFYINGEVQNPPAPSALDHFPILIENGIVKVDIGTKLARTRFDKSQITYA